MREVPDLAQIHRRHKDVKPEPMFEMAPGNAEPAPKAKSRKSEGRRFCPTCKAKVRTLYERTRGGQQALVFADHDRVTYAGHRFRCTSSGADASKAAKAS